MSGPICFDDNHDRGNPRYNIMNLQGTWTNLGFSWEFTSTAFLSTATLPEGFTSDCVDKCAGDLSLTAKIIIGVLVVFIIAAGTFTYFRRKRNKARAEERRKPPGAAPTPPATQRRI